MRVAEQLGDAGRADQTDARYDASDQDKAADHHLDHGRAERQSFSELVLHLFFSSCCYSFSLLFFDKILTIYL